MVRDLTELGKLHSSKWLRYPADVLPMHVAEMDFEVDPGVRAMLTEMVAKSDLGYLGPIPEVAEGFVGFAQRHWGWTPDAAQVRMTTDVGVGVGHHAAAEPQRTGRAVTRDERAGVGRPVEVAGVDRVQRAD